MAIVCTHTWGQLGLVKIVGELKTKSKRTKNKDHGAIELKARARTTDNIFHAKFVAVSGGPKSDVWGLLRYPDQFWEILKQKQL